MERLHDLCNDYKVASLKLLQLHSNCPQVASYVEALDDCIDGTLYIYMLMDRYGIKHQLKVVKKHA